MNRKHFSQLMVALLVFTSAPVAMALDTSSVSNFFKSVKDSLPSGQDVKMATLMRLLPLLEAADKVNHKLYLKVAGAVNDELNTRINIATTKVKDVVAIFKNAIEKKKKSGELYK